MHHSLVKQNVEECVAWIVLSDCFSVGQLAWPPRRHTRSFIYLSRQKDPALHRQAAAQIPAEARPDRRSVYICASWWRYWCVRPFEGWMAGQQDQHMHARIYMESITEFPLTDGQLLHSEFQCLGGEEARMRPISAAVITTLNHKSCH